MSIKYYTTQLAGILPDLFVKKSAFLRAFGGTLQVQTGVKQGDTFMTLKTNDTDTVIQTYSTDPNVAFGTGTGNSNRFGERQEVIIRDKKVDFDAPLAIHKGIDGFTVNDTPDSVVAEELAKNTVAWTQYVDGLLGKLISDKASETLTGDLTTEGVTEAFNKAHKTFLNNGVSEAIGHIAYVTADVYNLLVDSGLATTAKNSTVNVDANTLPRFKGFELVELPETKFQTGEQIYFVAENIGVAGIGLQVARTFDSEAFAGVAIQAAAQYGKYVPDANTKAILKAKLTPAA